MTKTQEKIAGADHDMRVIFDSLNRLKRDRDDLRDALAALMVEAMARPMPEALCRRVEEAQELLKRVRFPGGRG